MGYGQWSMGYGQRYPQPTQSKQQKQPKKLKHYIAKIINLPDYGIAK
jgi:hypothetical protein